MTQSRSLADWLTHLESIHPKSIDLGLDRVRAVALRLGLLPVDVPVLTVAGTNGKGSTVACAAALLSAGGLSVGVFTSPHFLRFNERIEIDGVAAGDAEIVAAFEKIETARSEISLTYFEFSLLAALLVFRGRAVDAMVLEVGLGGRLDAVNIVDADVSVITSIALDHADWLGSDLNGIALEKAGIARAGRPVILAERDYPETLLPHLENLGARVFRVSVEPAGEGALAVSWGGGMELSVPHPVGLIANNVAAATAAVAALAPDLDLTEASQCLAGVTVPGRRQRVEVEGIDVWLDVAHNPAAAAVLWQDLGRHEHGTTHAIVGVLGDKDIAGILAGSCSVIETAVACGLPDAPRGCPAATVAAALESAGIGEVDTASDPASAWEQVISNAARGDRVVVFGSFFTVAGIMRVLCNAGRLSAESLR